MLTTKSSGGLKLLKQIAALNLPASRRKQWHNKMGRQVIKSARQNIRQQRTVDGQPFAKSKSGKRVLRKLARGKNLKVYAGANKATVTWPNTPVGKIARAHQEGYQEQYTGEKIKRQKGQPDYDAPATSDQAKALIKAGYKLNKGKYKSGKSKGQVKTKRVSQAWIKENMTLGQAGLVLRMLQNKTAASSWAVNTPARPFFGLNAREIETLGTGFINQILSEVKTAK
jgi:hypothetical protein